MKQVIVKKEMVARCDYSVALLENGLQKERHEFRGDAGEAAAQALALSSRNNACKIIASKEIMDILE
jgi:hypothetical protein